MVNVPVYHKINSVYKRYLNGPNKNKFIIGDFSQQEFEYLFKNIWIGTEKIDGTNIRIIYDRISKEISFRGRNDNSQIPSLLADVLNTLSKRIQPLLEDIFPPTENGIVILYGEGYGNKIQGVGSKYIPDGNNFILFDIKVGDSWLLRKDVEEIASKLNIYIVPIVFEGDLEEAIDMVKKGFKSKISKEELDAEGLVLTPKIPLYSRNGDRIIVKVKTKDFK